MLKLQAALPTRSSCSASNALPVSLRKLPLSRRYCCAGTLSGSGASSAKRSKLVSGPRGGLTSAGQRRGSWWVQCHAAGQALA